MTATTRALFRGAWARLITRAELCALALALLGAGTADPAGAQSATTSAVTGQVTTQQGQPLPGVQVVVTNAATGGTYGTITRSDGRYLLPGLPPGGPYRVEARAIGYETTTYLDVNLAISQTQKFDFQLGEQAVAVEGITVTSERGAIISKDRIGTSTVVNDSAISRLPTITRDFTDFVRLSPQISTSGAGAQAGGRNNRYNSIQIDGSVNNDLFGLAASGTPGGQAGAKPISLEAIQEFQVVISPMDVRQGGFTGAGINAVTKSGTNDFRGSLFYFNKNDALVGDYTTLAGEESGAFPDFYQHEAGFALGGPILKDRVHFFVNGELNRRSAPIGLVAGEGDAQIRFEEAQAVADILRNQYGYEPGAVGALNLRRESDLAFGRLDWQINNGHRLTLRHNYVDAFDDNLSRSNSTYRLGGNAYAFNSLTNSTVAQLNSNFGNRFFNELRLGYQTIRDQREPEDIKPSVRVILPGQGFRSIFAGSEQFSGRNALDQDAFTITNDLTFAVGRHNITLGTHNEFFEFSNLFVRNAFGYYQFDSPEDLAAGVASQFEYSYLLPGGAPRAEFPVRQNALYVQDQFNLSDDFTLTAGLRAEFTSLPESPAYNPLVEEFFGRNTSEVPTSTLLNPRLGFNWDVTGDQTTQLRGGVGMFSGRTPGVWISNAFGNTGMEYVRFTCRGSRTPGFVADPNNQPQTCAGSTSLAPNEINTIDPEFEMPQVWRANIAIDRRLPFDFIGTLEALYTGTVNDIVYRDLSIEPAPGGATVEGRPRFQRRFSRSELPSIGNVYEISNTEEGRSYSVTTGLQRRFLERFMLDASYTFSQAKDVNPGTSSQASSNFRFLPVRFDPNNPELATSNFEVPHRVLLSGSYQGEWLRRAATNLSFIYVGESGRPFSFIYSGDVNNDGQRFNDLVFVPASAADVRFEGTAAEQAASFQNLERFINSFECLQEARGQVMERNTCREPWQNRLDVRFAQVIPSVARQNLQLTVDILNFGNLLNDDWGRNKFVSFGTGTLLQAAGRSVNADAQGRVLYRSFDSEPEDIYSLGDLSSRYQIQLGLKYSF